MTPRLDPFAAASAPMTDWLSYSRRAGEGLEHSLQELVKIRASQINGCAHCLAMHTRDARKGGESEDRIYLLDAWRETTVYTPRERAALAWTEALTLISTRPALDEVHAELRSQFSEEEQVKLTLLVNVINSWNRIAIGFGAVAGSAGRQAAA